MTDSIADMLTRIRNAQAVKKELVVVPYATLLWNIAKLLEQEGYLQHVTRRGRKTKRFIEAALVYNEHARPHIQGIRRISRPGRRVYQRSNALRPVKSNLGFSVVSTSRGLMTNKTAKKEKLGGEVMLEIW